MSTILKLILLLTIILFSQDISAQDKKTLIEQALDSVESSKEKETSMDIIINLSEEEEVKEEPVETKYKLVASDKPILIKDLNFSNADIRDALYEIEKKSGLIMIIDYDVKGTATLKFKEINVWDALKAILEANELAYSEEYGIVRVMTTQSYEEKFSYSFGGGTESHIANLRYVKAGLLVEQLNEYKSEEGKVIADYETNTILLIDSIRHMEKMIKLIVELDVPFETEVFYLRYALVANVKKVIDQSLTKEIGRVTIDPRTNKIVVTDTPLKIKEITQIIMDMDKKIDVQIGMQVYAIRLSEEHNKGVDWEAIIGEYQEMILTQEKEEKGENQRISVGTITNEDYEILLEALETVGESEKLKDTDMTITVNQGSYISYNSDAMLSMDEDSMPHQEEDEKDKESDFGFDMKIVPQLKAEDTLMFSLQPELQFASLNNTKNKKRDIFSFEGDIVVKVKKDEVIVLGGIVQQREVKKVSKFPLLGDIPLLGTVFRRRGQSDERTEYVVFLTQRMGKKNTVSNDL